MVRQFRTPVQWQHKHRYRRLLPSWWPKDSTTSKPRRKRRETEREAIVRPPAEQVIVGEELLIG